ncbi:LysE family translocator [Microbacterium oleivorans]|uniref:LysE family translocator n=1 Tax=Microbacterium oleivorans TaxID=273677 RepID=A0A4R5YKT7_9MICO|nr:LysE family translocator [Microbacterium oleivorans]TDL44027.1 LysE family translocator [Microbacterium oleivorans]
MIPIENLLAFALASIVIIVIPGPGVLFVVGRSIALGRRAGVLSVLGNSLGNIPAILLVAFGVGAIVASSVVAFTAIKVVGAIYLVYLGVQAIRHRKQRAERDGRGSASVVTLLRQGFIVGLTNPKTIAFFVAVLPQFVARDAGPIWAQLLLLGLIFQVIALICDSTWAVAAGTARTWFGRSPRRLSTLSGAGGVLMIGLGGALALTGAKS